MSGKAILYRMVTEDHICPYGLKAKALLERKGLEVIDKHLHNRDETEAFKKEYDVKTTPQIFIDEKMIGGYDDLREYFGKKSKGKGEVNYQPIIAIFSVTFLMALALHWRSFQTLFSIQLILWFVSFSMCVLAIMKLRDLEAFTNQFLNYDLLARKVVRYAYIYPFAEVFAGVGMLTSFMHPIPAVVSLSIGSIGAVSVFKAVYIDKRELKCACVGGNSNVPLGFVSLTENLMMIFIGLWMLLN